MARSRSSLGRAALAALALGLLGSIPAVAQRNVYCNITRITTRRLANAVQITIQADGTMRVELDAADYFNIPALQEGRMDDGLKPVTTLPLRITNARSRVPRLTDVGLYPASYVEVAAPPDAPDGIGLNVNIGLFVPATTLSLQTPDGPDISWMTPKGPTVTMQLTQDRTGLIVLLTSDRRTQAPFVRRTAPEGAPVEMSVFADGDRVSVHALNADLRDVVRALARATNREVVLDGVLDHTVSMDFRDAPLDGALDAIAQAYGLSAETPGRAIRLTEGSATSLPAYIGSTLETIPLRNMTAAAARNALPEFLLGFVQASERRNALTVVGPHAMVDKLRADIARLDTPVPQISLECRLVEMDRSDDLTSALAIGVRGREASATLNSNTGDISFRTMGILPEAYTERLRALERSGRARTVASPSTTALNGQTASLFVGRQQFIKIDYFDENSEAFVSKILAIPVGVSLTATPWTGDGKTITISLTPSLTSISETEARTGLPTVFTRRATSTVRIQDGDTLLIGGLQLTQDEAARSGIRGLFRMPSRAKNTNELALLLTARVTPAPAPQAKHT